MTAVGSTAVEVTIMNIGSTVNLRIILVFVLKGDRMTGHHIGVN